MISKDSLGNVYQRVMLGEVVEFLDNLRKPVKESQRIPGPYPYYGANGQIGTINEYIFDEDLILLAEDGGHFGNPNKPIAFKVNGKCWVNNHAHVLRPRGVDINFLKWHLQHYDVRTFITGSTRPKLNKTNASNIPLILPPLPIQKQIAAILDIADDLRCKRQQASDLLDDLLRSIFLDMFGDPITNPKKWNEKFIGDVCKVTKLAGFEYTKYVKYKEHGDITVIRGLNIKECKLNVDNVRYIDQETSDFLWRSKLFKGDIVMTYIGVNIGDVALIQESGKYHLAPNVAKITPKKSSILEPRYLMHYLALNKIKMRKYTTNTAKQALNMSNIRQLKIFLPNLDLQKKFSVIDMIIYLAKGKMQKSLEEMDNLFHSLMQRAFKGELKFNENLKII